ncbi:SURF1 family protein [Sphingomonas sp. So64.6b]|uniref:SURF1 family protein n=1 Tax=Sphingomonas sp. So64.6b TaxID=2997354 RepID=UPI0015FF68DD|nr:SURF1 family protein [Sphingomonas sp. So64.6b]QNA84493.1 SURF1 family protein [Sphingomonas sp. So64.6b]
MTPRATSARSVIAGLVALLLIAPLLGLGTWQVKRLAWKRDLIAQVDARVHAAPVAVPGPTAWPEIDGPRAQYRRVRLTGRFLPVPPALVQAATVHGAGWWVMAPLRTGQGFVVLANRGFVPTRAAAPPPLGPVILTGLLRVAEPGGGFLRSNDPARDAWYSRDVAAIAAARRLGVVAPYFVDLDAASSPPGGPIGGLTIIAFPNNHLVYAITWYVLAMMVAGALVIFLRADRRAAPQ